MRRRRLGLDLSGMLADIERVLISQWQIRARVEELAGQITRDLSSSQHVAEPELTIIPVMTGAMIFASDLIRHIPIAMRIGLLTVSSYPGAAMTTQGSAMTAAQLPDLTGRHVLAIDDILDSGGTLRLVRERLVGLGAAEVRTAVLLRKKRPEAMSTPCDYVGFDIPDEFVVGYGLDYNNYYRNLPDIVTLTPAAVARRKEA
jgi:hypoxanthine phosphoribosyltransferase